MSLLCLLMALSAPAVWMAPLDQAVLPDAAPRPMAEGVRLYGAKGEWETVQLCVTAGRRDLKDVEIAVESPPGFDPPELRLLGYLQTPAGLVPDPLLPYAPFDVPRGQTRAVWVTWRIPKGVAAGLHDGEVTVLARRRRALPLRIEVFDFALPATPTLRTLAPLGRESIRRAYRIPDTPLERWKPVYDGLAPYGVSYRVWDGGPLCRAGPDGRLSQDILRDHLDHILRAGGVSAVALGPGRDLGDLVPRPSDPVALDPLRPYLNEMGNWLGERGRLEQAVIQPVFEFPRDRWQTARETHFRVRLADKRIARILEAPFHPWFERYTEIHAAPLRFYDGAAAARLRAGVSLRQQKSPAVRSVRASSERGPSEHNFFAARAGEGCDGSPFTAWVSAGDTRRGTEWLEIELEEEVVTGRVRITWVPGLEADDVRIVTARREQPMSPASADWRHEWTTLPGEESWSAATLRVAKGFAIMRLEFRATRRGRPVGVRDVSFGDPEDADAPPPEGIPPVETWLAARPGDFPRIAPGPGAREARLWPWVCRARQASGLLLPALCRWPADWAPAEPDSLVPWRWDGEAGGEFLFYPGADGPWPSVRAVLLRDGLEDYEYLAFLDAAPRNGYLMGHDPVVRWLVRVPWPHDPPADAVRELADAIPDARVEMGRAIGALEEQRGP